MRDNIVDYNVMHTMACRIMNSMQYILININFYYFSYIFIIFNIFPKFSFPNSFKMLAS